MSTVGSICANLSITLRAPKSGEHDDQTAPRLAVASRPMIASGPFGRRAATRAARDASDLRGEFGVTEAPSSTAFGRKNKRGAVGVGPRGPQRVARVVEGG